MMVDNYDSFTYNLVHLFEELGAEVVTVRNDAITVQQALDGSFDRLVVSPGPGRPEHAGVSIEIMSRTTISDMCSVRGIGVDVKLRTSTSHRR